MQFFLFCLLSARVCHISYRHRMQVRYVLPVCCAREQKALLLAKSSMGELTASQTVFLLVLDMIRSSSGIYEYYITMTPPPSLSLSLYLSLSLSLSLPLLFSAYNIPPWDIHSFPLSFSPTEFAKGIGGGTNRRRRWRRRR
jgi:hypothetical protein